MSAAVKYDDGVLTAPTPRLTRAERRRHLKLIVNELQRRQPPDDLQPKQRVAFDSIANEKLYGGAAYGGKSYLMRRLAIWFAKRVPGIQIYLFRREYNDLFKNHMESEAGFPAMLVHEVERKEARILWGDKQIRFAHAGHSDAVIHLCHCQYEKDVHGYQGAEIHILLIDELTQWTEKMYTMLRGRVRLGSLKVPKWLRKWLPLILCGANPGGIGHNWVKASWIDIAPPMQITAMPKAEGGMRRQFIPALLEDNPIGVENDPEYEARLEGLHDKQLARAMRRGDWDIVAGGFFDDIWQRDVHVIEPFTIPKSWKIDRSFDWGSSKPFSVGWWAESDGTEATLRDGSKRKFPRGTLFRIAEWYGWNGKANEGCKMLAADVAKGIVAVEKQFREKLGWIVQPGPADSAIYAVEDGNSIAKSMEKHGVLWVPADNSPGSRKTGWEKLRERLKAAMPRQVDGITLPLEDPALFAFSTCVHWIRCVPVLPRDQRNPDDVDTKAEDHNGDETRYRLLAPATPTIGFTSLSI